MAFLPIFFTALAIFFVAAVWLRLREYERIDAATTTAPHEENRSTDTNPDRGVLAEGGSEVALSTIEELTPSGERISSSAREQRYNELLRSAPPAAPQPVETPSLLDRVVAPIANALGMRPKPQPQPAQPQPQQQTAQRMQEAQPSPSSGGRDGNRNEDSRGAAEDDDPDTDVTAPQLMSAEFQPQQLHDGEETVFVTTVNDNLSGVRSVSGVIASPSGSMQGFACAREAETNRFLAKIAIPKDAPSGVWVVKYLTLTDNASNSVNLNAASGALPGSASFRVTSADADATGPQLKALWLDKQAMRAGERNTIFVQAEDDKAGVSLVSGVFVSPSKTARIGFGCKQGSASWECSITPPACLDCGVWKLEQIQLQDKANNLATFRGDNELVARTVLDIAGDRCDNAPPVITSLVLDPTVISNAQATVIQVRATVVDDGGCGVASLSGQATPPGGIGGQRRYISFAPSPDGTGYTGTLEIPQFAAKGQWSIAWIQALDKGHNLRAYSTSEPVVARATFRVE